MMFSQVQIETQSMDHVTMATMNSSPMIAIPVEPSSPDAATQATVDGVLGNKRTHSQAELTL